MVNAISEQTNSSKMSEKIDIPIICIDDDDEDDDLKIDNSYMSFLDHLTDDNNLGPLFKASASDLDHPLRYGAANGKSEIRRFDTFFGHSKRIDNENNRVSQQRKRETGGFKSEISRAFPITIENIHRDNRIAERRKKRIAELEAASVSRAVPLTITRGNTQQDNRVTERRKRKMTELEAASVSRAVPLTTTQGNTQLAERRKRRVVEVEAASVSRAVPFVKNYESFPRADRVGILSELEDGTLGTTHLFRTEEDIQRDNKVAEQRKRRVTELEDSRVFRAAPLVRNHESIPRDGQFKKYSELEDETLGDAPLVRTEENIQSEWRKRKAETLRRHFSLVKTEEDNKVADRRKRRVTELEAARFSRDVPLVRNHESIPRDGNVQNFLVVEDDETLRDAPLVRTEEDIQRDNKVSEGRKRKSETLRKDVCLVIIEEDDTIAETMVVNETSKSVPVELNPVNESSRDELEAARVSRAIPLVRNHESFPRNNKVGKFSELEDKTLGEAPLVRTEEYIQRDHNVSEARKRKTETLRKDFSSVRTEEDNRIAETMVVNETSKAVPMKLNPVNETSRIVQVTQPNKGFYAGIRKNHEKSVNIVDKDYMSYLTWLVDSLKDSIPKPISNLQKDLSDLDPPVTDTHQASTMVPEEDLLVEVKVELDLESWSSDDSDIIEVRDTPFSDGEDSPFVASKSVIIDLDKETSKEDESSCWFRKELMNDLKRPYNETEWSRLYREVSIHRRMTRCRELRKGRETDYETEELGKSYLERFDDFNRVYKRVDRNDKASALKLLRGFFFYLKHVSHDGAFKPWMDPP